MAFSYLNKKYFLLYCIFVYYYSFNVLFFEVLKKNNRFIYLINLYIAGYDYY